MIRARILGFYLARQYLLWLLVFLGGLAGIVFLFEVAELLRRSTSRPDATFWVILRMGSYKLPDTIERILPFVVLFAGLFTFWRLTRTQELVVARAAGVSVWQFLMPALGVTFLFALVHMFLLNSVGAALNARYKEMETQYIRRGATLELTGAGLWLRQTEGDRQYLLHADHVEMEPLTLAPLIAFVYDRQNRYLGRLDAPRAVLGERGWEIDDAWDNAGGEAPVFRKKVRIATTLTLERVQESMAPPNTISFWKLPGFIEALRAIGLPSTRHEMAFQGLLAAPVLLCAMVLFAAAFSLRLNRRGGILNAMMAGIFTGSAVFSLNNVVQALGVNETLPVALAAWAIPLTALAAGQAALLHLEDG